MPARISPARRAAFLRCVRETGNLTLAAERVKVTNTWHKLLRKRDPAFARDLDAALDAARERLGVPHATAVPRDHLGEELVLLGQGFGTRIQLIRARPKQWTERLERRFLEVLAATCNASAACRTVGLTYSSAYQRRRRNPDFAARWDATVEAGMANLEARLLELVCDGSDAPMPDGPPRIVNVHEAIAMLSYYRRRQVGTVRRGGVHARAAPIEDVARNLIKRLKRMGVRLPEPPDGPGG